MEHYVEIVERAMDRGDVVDAPGTSYELKK